MKRIYMNEKYKKIVTFVLFAVVIIVVSFSMLTIFARFFGFSGGLDNAVTVPISGPMLINENEAVFTPDSPLQISRTSSKVLLRSAEIRDADLLQGTILLSDGSTRKVSVSLEDTSGREYTLVLMSVGPAIGFGFSEDDLATLDKNTSFRAVKVRSDAPISLDAIEWYSWTGK